jgi:hypothetical protein
MTNDIERYEPIPQVMSLGQIQQEAELLASSSIVPKQYRGKPADIIAASLMGRDVGLSPFASMNYIHVIDGKPSLSAEAMVMLARRAGHSITGETSSTGARADGKRGDTRDEMSATFTNADATAAGLLGGTNWKKYPQDMYWARAVSALCRRLFPDVFLGAAYTADELGAQVTEDGEVIAAAVDVVTINYADIIALYLSLPDASVIKIDKWVAGHAENTGEQTVEDLDDMPYSFANRVRTVIENAHDAAIDEHQEEDDDIEDAELVNDAVAHIGGGKTPSPPPTVDKASDEELAQLDRIVLSLSGDIWPDLTPAERSLRRKKIGRQVTNSKRTSLKAMTTTERTLYIDILEALRTEAIAAGASEA